MLGLGQTSSEGDGLGHQSAADARILDPVLLAARATAREGRDSKRGNEALVNLWREVSKPRKGGAIKPQPAGCKLDSPELFQEWLNQRGLHDALKYTGDQQGWSVYRYTRKPVVKSEKWWETAFHGSWWYSVWLILETGIFLESDDKGLGHDFWEPGVYCSPSLDTGLWYARPQILFNDEVFHRIIFELRVDPDKRKKNRARGGIQWVFPCEAVSLHGVWVRHNAPPSKGEERVNGWEADLEALPPGASAPVPTVNTRTGAWPHYVDPHPFQLDDNSVPPWMMCGKKAKVEGGGKGGGAAPTPAGGLYGRWLRMAEAGQLHASWTPGAKGAAKGGGGVGALIPPAKGGAGAFNGTIPPAKGWTGAAANGAAATADSAAWWGSSKGKGKAAGDSWAVATWSGNNGGNGWGNGKAQAGPGAAHIVPAGTVAGYANKVSKVIPPAAAGPVVIPPAGMKRAASTDAGLLRPAKKGVGAAGGGSAWGGKGWAGW